MKENRRNVRYPISLMAWCARDGKKADKARTVDISSSGVLINRLFSVNTPMKVSFALPTLKDDLVLRGKVVREGAVGSGILFYNDPVTNTARHIIEDFILQASKPDLIKKNEMFLDVLRSHKSDDEKNIRVIFYFATKLLLCRSELTEKILKRKEICQAVEVVRTHLDAGFCYESVGLLPQNLEHSEAIDYYGKSVQGAIKDFHGREVLIDEEGLEFLFKDPKTHKHDPDMKPDNYQPPRGRRLPWLRDIISKSHEIYEHYELQRQETIYYYAARVTIKTLSRSIVNYFLIVTYKKKGQPITFKTAYFMEDRLDFFRAICQGRLFVPPVQHLEGNGIA